MKSPRQQRREARRLFRTCVVDGSLDEARVRRVVQRTIDAGGVSDLKLLSRFQRLVRIDRAAHSARVESRAPLPDEVRASIESGVRRLYGRGIAVSYAENGALLGGVRVTVGSDVYDGSVRGRLDALSERF
jgi:F-type H+-transporting ATPase subunit delta